MNGLNKKITARVLKKKIIPMLIQDDFQGCIENLRKYPGRQVINPLISCFCDSTELVRWRSISAAGKIISDLANIRIEDARILMRRLMWTLNDESGGIGWGSPEAMGEAMALSEKLSGEYSRMLISYLREDGNFLEHEMLQRGVLWGVLQLSEIRPELADRATDSVRGYLRSPDSVKRGLAAMIAGALKDEGSVYLLEYLQKDSSVITIYRNYILEKCSVMKLAKESLIKINDPFQG
jgi:hypothetical protein